MFRSRLLRFVFLTLPISVACSDAPSINGDSEELFQSTVTDVQNALPETNRENFSRAIEGFEFLYGENALSVLADSDRIKTRVRNRLSGLDGQEVLELWDERRERAIRELEIRKSSNESAQEQMAAVEIEKSVFRINKAGQRIVELKLKNNTEHHISHVYIRGILTSPRRSKPWVDDTFHYPFELKPGDSVEQKFALLGAPWQDAPKGRRNLKLTATVIRIDSGHETPIYDAYTNPFTPHDQVRLEKLISFRAEDSASPEAE